jgi:hypothetical protein
VPESGPNTFAPHTENSQILGLQKNTKINLTDLATRVIL